MKTLQLTAALMFIAVACCAQSPSPFGAPGQPGLPPRPFQPQAQSAEAHKPPVNYIIRVEWKEPKEDKKYLEILTTEGSFNLNTIQKNPVKINNNEIPITLKFSGTLTPLDDQKGRLQLFLGRTVPYVTGTSGGVNAFSSYSQISVGLDSTFVVPFGKPQVIQSDENGDISILVKRVEN